MFRHAIYGSRPLNSQLWQIPRRFASQKSSGEADEEAIKAARKWLANLDADTIRNDAVCDISFSRSSGPGGQNVNKVSSKATLRISTSSLLPLIPNPLHPSILSSRYYAAKSNELVIQSDDSRKQNENVNNCFRRLHELILEAGRVAVPGETSEETTKRVEGLQKVEKIRRRKEKERRSEKKSARRSGGRGED